MKSIFPPHQQLVEWVCTCVCAIKHTHTHTNTFRGSTTRVCKSGMELFRSKCWKNCKLNYRWNAVEWAMRMLYFPPFGMSREGGGEPWKPTFGRIINLVALFCLHLGGCCRRFGQESRCAVFAAIRLAAAPRCLQRSHNVGPGPDLTLVVARRCSGVYGMASPAN